MKNNGTYTNKESVWLAWGVQPVQICVTVGVDNIDMKCM